MQKAQKLIAIRIARAEICREPETGNAQQGTRNGEPVFPSHPVPQPQNAIYLMY
jgi:hypothetical protein